jgi:hypothetical protein
MKKEAEICYGHCGSDDDCPSECAYCWPTRVGGSVSHNNQSQILFASFREKLLIRVAH